MSGHMEITYEKHDIAKYVTEVLSLQLCTLFLKTGFVDGRDHLLASYDTEGYRPLSDAKKLRTEDVFTVAIALLHGIYQSEKHYLFSEFFEIEPGWIFADESFRQVKLAFVPAKERRSLREKLAGLLLSLAPKCGAGGRAYIEKAVSLIKTEEYGHQSLVHHLEKLRREVYLCSVK